MSNDASALEPRASRPHMPAYQIGASEEGLLDWSWAEERLRASQNYWLATVRPGGRPHLMAVWALWCAGELFFSTDGVKAANLEADARCSIATEDGREAVVLEGVVRLVPRGAEWDQVRRNYGAKYGEGFPEGSPLFVLGPEVAFGFIEAVESFATSATRWRFDVP